jgi:L-threonylcarbamoyladenylate synthase
MIVLPTASTIAQAAKRLAAGDIIGLPTETVYGLAADACNASAVAKVYQTKGRPSDHPLIIHLAPQADITLWASHVPQYAKALMAAFWPGACTLVLPRTAMAGDFVTGNQATVALRCPSHPVAQQVLQACAALGVHGLAAPSANRFGRVSPTTAQHVYSEFANLSELLILDGGACDIGIESTIVDCTQARPRILRHGLISSQELIFAAGCTFEAGVGSVPSSAQATPRVSGSLAAHYAPNTPLHLCAHQNTVDLVAGTVYMGFEPPLNSAARYHAMPRDSAQYAQQLYAVLRNLDAMAYAAIAVEPVPDTAVWAGVSDRLARAAATFGLAK